MFVLIQPPNHADVADAENQAFEAGAVLLDVAAVNEVVVVVPEFTAFCVDLFKGVLLAVLLLAAQGFGGFAG